MQLCTWIVLEADVCLIKSPVFSIDFFLKVIDFICNYPLILKRFKWGVKCTWWEWSAFIKIRNLDRSVAQTVSKDRGRECVFSVVVSVKHEGLLRGTMPTGFKWQSRNLVSKRDSGDWLMLADRKAAQKRINIKTCLRHTMTLHCCCNNMDLFLFLHKHPRSGQLNIIITWHVKTILNTYHQEEKGLEAQKEKLVREKQPYNEG